MATLREFTSKFIKLKTLSDATGIGFYRLYYRKAFGAKRDRINLNERTKIANTLMNDIKPFFQDLGFDVKMIRLKE
jgi:hypothetical protein